MPSLSLMAGRVNDGRWGTVLPGDPNFPLGNIEYYLVGGQLDVRFNGRLRGGVVSFALLPDDSVPLPVSFAAPNGESETDVLVWTVGAAYRPNPAVEFELAYDATNYGSTGVANLRNGSDDILRFRTFVTF